MWADLAGAFAFLTILPIRAKSGTSGRIFAYFPLVGLVIGAIVALVASIPFLPRDAVGFLALLVWVALTGALHLDGFADACDGLLSTTTVERRLEIMKDPRTGSWAVVGVVLLLLGKWVAIRDVPPLLLIAPPALGRCAMVFAAYAFPNARTSGSGAHFRKGLERSQVIVAVVLTALILAPLVVVGGLCVTLALVAMWIVVAGVGVWAARRLGGGLTGDVYGAICELTELVTLFILIGR
jgi:adenosylcobinamide-GDP ribazoletransferase